MHHDLRSNWLGKNIHHVRRFWKLSGAVKQPGGDTATYLQRDSMYVVAQPYASISHSYFFQRSSNLSMLTILYGTIYHDLISWPRHFCAMPPFGTTVGFRRRDFKQNHHSNSGLIEPRAARLTTNKHRRSTVVDDSSAASRHPCCSSFSFLFPPSTGAFLPEPLRTHFKK